MHFLLLMKLQIVNKKFTFCMSLFILFLYMRITQPSINRDVFTIVLIYTHSLIFFVVLRNAASKNYKEKEKELKKKPMKKKHSQQNNVSFIYIFFIRHYRRTYNFNPRCY
jgi:phosphotransferase system  glucose/maltose/N-acetylglucosamine-specific IIC component